MTAPLPADHFADAGKPCWPDIAPAILSASADVLAEHLRARDHFGHDAADDLHGPADRLAGLAAKFAQIAADRSAGAPTARDLPNARKKAVQAAALLLAHIARLDHDIAAEAAHREAPCAR